ncbi:trypsin-like peptidase domain-containing protein [Microbispora sp. NPDC049125]|uniref:trypsin-like peptidase domain-containing protein n=1 Tax=Microbispora sp. NPDC049125 TaxID=3154929 RepID=UPI0034653376
MAALVALLPVAGTGACDAGPPRRQAVYGPSAAPALPSASAAGVAVALGGVVHVAGYATGCRRHAEGAGFVYAPERIMLTAHTVAGVDRDLEVVLGGGRRLPAKVVLFDSRLDVAVLRVPGLPARPLRLLPKGAEDTKDIGQASIVYFPPGATAPVQFPAVLGHVSPASGPDIYGAGDVTKEVRVFTGPHVDRSTAGAPLVSESDVVGMVFAADMDSKADKGYALPAGQLSAAATAGRQATTPVSTRRCS